MNKDLTDTPAPKLYAFGGQRDAATAQAEAADTALEPPILHANRSISKHAPEEPMARPSATAPP